MVRIADPLLEPVALADADVRWAEQAAVAAADLSEVLERFAPAIEHIGSTSVPIRGKPIIDLQVAVRSADVAEVITRIESLGYQHHGDAGVPGRQYLTCRCDNGPWINVHVFARGNVLLEDNRLIRDYLRAHPDVAQRYVSVKEQAIAQGHTELGSYSDAKAIAVAAIREAAHREAQHAVQPGAMDDKVNLAEKFARLERPYAPGIVGYMNDYKLQIVKVKGPFVWHKHDDTDDFFLVVEGRLTIQLRDRNIVLEPGELFVVPRGVEHCPTADEETHVLLIEPRGTPNTGDAGGELTAEPIEL